MTIVANLAGALLPSTSETRASNAREGEGSVRLCRMEGGGKAPV